MNGFDLLAPIYDRLVRLVFGKSMFNAQTYFLDRVKPGDHVLILGGGTGWLLFELLQKQPSCKVWYVESSSRMIELAKEKTHNHPNVKFIAGTDESIPSKHFDIVIMNFFLDLFTEGRVTRIIMRIKASMKPDGMWIITDFNNGNKWWQRVLLAIMIFFFRLICAIEAKRLPDFKSLFAEQHLAEISGCSFFKGFIKAGLYQIPVKMSVLSIGKKD